MRYYIDTEFVETPGHIELISIGIVAQDGREYYAVNTEADLSQADDWVKRNVLSSMPEYNMEENTLRNYQYIKRDRPAGCQDKKTIADMKEELLLWCGQQNNVPEECEFWGYYADYDWVVFCWIFGRMIDLPKGFPMYCRDLKQLMSSCTLLDKEWKQQVCPDPVGEHNALVDARWNKKLHKAIAKAMMDNTAGNILPI